MSGFAATHWDAGLVSLEGCPALSVRSHLCNWCYICPSATKHRRDVVQASTKPVVVTIVDRPYRAGRHILNVQDLQARVMGKWPDAVVQVVHIEGLDLKQQIALFQHTSILIWTHGAAMADLLFLPQVPLPISVTASLCISHTAVSGRVGLKQCC